MLGYLVQIRTETEKENVVILKKPNSICIYTNKHKTFLIPMPVEIDVKCP